MASASAPRRAANGGALSIGQVLARLSAEFPGLTASKLRFLEVQGIVTPLRTESGYRKFTLDDVERLRLALTLQRDHYLPLARIREYMADVDAGRAPSAPVSVPPSITPAPRRYRRDELLRSAAASPQLLNDAISTGVIAASDSYTDQTLAVLRSLVALERHGIEPRHIRTLRQSVDREVALIESALAPLLRRTDAASRGRAGELAPELAARLADVRSHFVRAALERLVR
ncbi:MerR family transcriptional regulator [Microbacterium protaetiae]|uniref:MerR family transcriptional regulator n=1 Tax=Microbacterium protaetiae TaxID=2509458 RepID=A0A4V0YDR3_9MICO|nr:MerR family transcriptional regulator [Microbacterium protaetiae]QAY61611.1 MerR family transcriptional regulator [Microbacterium protaetiae]